MLKRDFSKKFELNQKGVGLIGVMIAAALVVIAALAVSNFIVDQSRLSKKLQISGSCQNIANSLVEFIKKDEASLFINSYGATPGTINFPAGIDQTEDGIDRFAFGGPIPVYTGTPAMTIADSVTAALPATISYHNHLNIKNSTNRLIALAFTRDYCAGARYFDNFNNADGTLDRPGFVVSEKDVEVDLQVDFQGINCVNRLTLAQLPTSTQGTTAEFDIDVVIKRGQPDQQSCRATGIVSRTRDTNSALTLLEYETDLCANGSTGYPAQCGASAPVNILVRTIKNTPTCQTNCARSVTSKTCATVDSGGTDLFDTDCPSDCLNSEPGSMFLCKIGEKNWFAGADNYWEPCESARVRDFNGVVTTGNVTITYLPTGNAEQNANARITLTNLPTNRSYVVNVRSVDTAGNIGPAFCSATGSASCDDGSRAHFSVINGTPTVGPLDDTTNRVENAGQAIGNDSALILTTPPKYSTALSLFPGKYQCENGGPIFSSDIVYSPAIPAGAAPLGATCTAILTRPDGTTLNIPSGASPATDICECINGTCAAKLSDLTARGTYTIRVTAGNDCGVLPAIPPQPWCLDNNPVIGATYGNSFNLNPTANFATSITEPLSADKACGVTSLCPNLDGSFTKSLTGCTAPGGWSAMSHSGCIADPNSNYCVAMIDPCGRYQQTTRNPAPPPAVSYATTLDSVAFGSAPADNQCYRSGGAQKGGNVCEPGSYCSRTGKCFNSCPTQGRVCTQAVDCEHDSYGVVSGDPNGPTCVGGRCVCPTNNNSPSATNCAPEYCPILNSCSFGLAATVPAGGACNPCSHWTVGDWTAGCSGGFQTRPVDCTNAFGCCIGPRPLDQRTCPNCTAPWGVVLDGDTVRAYSTASVACGSTCVYEDRTCTNGNLTGSFANLTCAPDACACSNPCAIRERISCFVAGTKVTLASGEKKNIEDISVGELVKTFDEVSNEMTVSPVEEIFHHEEKLSELYTFRFSNGGEVTSNDVHLIYSLNIKNYISAKEIYQRWRSGQEMVLLTENKETVTVENIDKSSEIVKLYNIHVTGAHDQTKEKNDIGHNYFANGILVHNEKAWQTVCGGLGLDVNGSGDDCELGPYLYNGACCESAGGIVIIDPTYPRGAWCEEIPDQPACDSFRVCAGMGAAGCPVDGQCGSADGVATSTTPPTAGPPPTGTNLCSRGTPSAVSGSGPWTWNCLSTDGGINDNCSAPLGSASGCWGDPVAGDVALVPQSCAKAGPCTIGDVDTTRYKCVTDTDGDGIPEYLTTFVLSCIDPGTTPPGEPGGCVLDATAVSTPGACGSAHNGSFADAGSVSVLCSAGTASLVPSGAGPWSWTCSGTNGGAASGLCTANQTAGVNSCDPVPACSPANCTATPGTPTSVGQNWVVGAPPCGLTCLNGYSGATCETAPGCPAGQTWQIWSSSDTSQLCSQAGGCAGYIGTNLPNPSGGSQIRCTDTYPACCSGGGPCSDFAINVLTCQGAVPGACGAATDPVNTCSAGTVNDTADSGSQYLWECVGTTTAPCSKNKPDCSLPWGGSISSGTGMLAYSSATVACGNTCLSETRNCVDGNLLGTYTLSGPTCTVTACATCNFVPRDVTCFVAGTQVELADGTTGSIENIKVGDKVVIFDEELNKKEISTVTETLHHEPKMQMMYKFNFENSDGFTVTGEHLIYTVKAGYVSAAALYEDFKNKKNNYLLDKDFSEIGIKNITAYEDVVPTYNLHVEGISDDISKYGRNGRGHNYFANGVLAHNLKACADLGYSIPPRTALGTNVNCLSTNIGTRTDMCGDTYTGCSTSTGSPECPTIENGVCGPAHGAVLTSSPTTDRCEIGTPSTPTGSGPWSWNCAGVGTGTTAICASIGASCEFLPRVPACFVAGTKVQLADGSQKSIEDIKLGDEVVTYDEELKVRTSSHVEKVLHHEPRLQMMYKFIFENGSEFIVTGEHLIYTVDSGFIGASELYTNWQNKVTNLLLDKNSIPTRIKHISAYEDNVATYNIHVKGLEDKNNKYGRLGRGHNYFANGMLAHNAKTCNDGSIDPGGNGALAGTNTFCWDADINRSAYDSCKEITYTECTNTAAASTCPDVGVCGYAHDGTYASPPPATTNIGEMCYNGTQSAVQSLTKWEWTCAASASTVNCSAFK